MKVYFCGSMTSSQEKMEFYHELIVHIDIFGEVINKFVGNKIVDLDPNVIYERDTTNMKNCDLVVADISIPSTGVGFELGYADLLNKKTLIIYDLNYKKPSSLIIGNANFLVKGYHEINEAKKYIEDFLTRNDFEQK